MLMLIEKVLVNVWQYRFNACLLLIGVFFFLVGVAGVLFSKHPLEGPYEFIPYGVIAIIAALKMRPERVTLPC